MSAGLPLRIGKPDLTKEDYGPPPRHGEIVTDSERFGADIFCKNEIITCVDHNTTPRRDDGDYFLRGDFAKFAIVILTECDPAHHLPKCRAAKFKYCSQSYSVTSCLPVRM